MGKKVTPRTKGAARVGPSQLVMRLAAPGMSLLHRAGLGGLACTLRYIERARRSAMLSGNEIPGDPWTDGKPPWTVTSTAAILDFGSPESAGEYLKRLFGVGFQIQDGLIYLPGQYGDVPPSKAVLAELQNGVLSTFLSHVPTAGSRSGVSPLTYEVDGKPLTLEYVHFTSYKHQAWYWLERRGQKTQHQLDGINADGTLSDTAQQVNSAVVPGGMVKHNKFASTSLAEPPERLIPLYFALVGCLALRFFRKPPGAKKAVKVGALVVPDPNDLLAFAQYRPLMTPVSVQECRSCGVSDAVLQAMLRMHVRGALASSDIRSFCGMQFRVCPWDTKRVPRTGTVAVETAEDGELDLFEKALAELSPCVQSREVSAGKGKSKPTRTEYFWVDSRTRPLIADNLAQGRPWCAGFATLVSTPDKARGISFEKKGLHAMIGKITWDNAGAETIVKAVHEAIRLRFGRIAEENRGKPIAMRNRWNSERERWRLAFVGAKTVDQFRGSLADLWSRAGSNAVLRGAWASVLPMLADDRWRLARDLALVGLASYAGKESEEMGVTDTQEEGDQE